MDTYHIPHCRSPKKIDTGVVCPLDVVNRGAVLRIIRTVVEMVGAIHKADSGHPVEHLLCPVKVGLVTSILSKTRAEIKETAVRDSVLIIVTAIKSEDLPL